MKIHYYDKQNIILSLRNLKNKPLSSKLSKAKFSHFEGTRGPENQIFCTYNGVPPVHKHTVNREIDNPKLESARFQDHLLQQHALDFSPDFDKLMCQERLKTSIAQIDSCRSKLFGINKDSSTVTLRFSLFNRL